MLTSLYRSNKKYTPILKDTLERLRVTAGVSSNEWFDILQLSWSDYQNIKLGYVVPSEKLTERVAQYFDLTIDDILYGKIDYKSLALHFETGSLVMPELYSKAAYGRKRTSISSIDFLENYVGWDLRLDAIRKLSVTESMLQDPFAPISMKFITDLCGYLQQRQFQKEDFFAMGAYTYKANKQTLVSELFSNFSSPKEAYEFFFNDCMKLFELNCTYTITKISDTSLTMEYLTNSDVAAESGMRHLGSVNVCQVKNGFASIIPRYLGLPQAKVNEVACVHCEDDICRLEIDFSAAQAQLSRSSLNH